MTLELKSKLLVSILLAVLTLFDPLKLAYADSINLDQRLRGHSLVYVDKKTGMEHTIYFGRFGNDYDEYFPCDFVDGTWRLTKEGALCLEDRANKNRRDGQTCLKPKFEGTQVSFYDSAGNLSYRAKLTKGNAMPLG